MRKNVLKESEDSLKKAVLFLKNEKLVSIKTETVYGLACESTSKIEKKIILFMTLPFLDLIPLLSEFLPQNLF